MVFQNLGPSLGACMNLDSDETIPWINDDEAAALKKHVLELAPRPNDSILRVPPRKGNSTLPEIESAHRAISRTYRRLTFLIPCAIGIAWLVGSRSIDLHRIVIQHASGPGAETGRPAQNSAEDRAAQEPRLDAASVPITLGTDAGAGLANKGPGREAGKTENSPGIAEASGKVEQSEAKTADKVPTGSGRPDSIGNEIAALSAATPVSDHPLSWASVERTLRRRGDAFDPSKHPNAPGAPRPLGALAHTATTSSASAGYLSASGARARTLRKHSDAFDPSKHPTAPGAPRPLGGI